MALEFWILLTPDIIKPILKSLRDCFFFCFSKLLASLLLCLCSVFAKNRIFCRSFSFPASLKNRLVDILNGLTANINPHDFGPFSELSVERRELFVPSSRSFKCFWQSPFWRQYTFSPSTNHCSVYIKVFIMITLAREVVIQILFTDIVTGFHHIFSVIGDNCCSSIKSFHCFIDGLLVERSPGRIVASLALH